MIRRPPRSTPFPTRRSSDLANEDLIRNMVHERAGWIMKLAGLDAKLADAIVDGLRKLTIDMAIDRKSTRLNSSHANISYAVFCLKKKKTSQSLEYQLSRQHC